jgi:hypothetical protein
MLLFRMRGIRTFPHPGKEMMMINARTSASRIMEFGLVLFAPIMISPF